MSFIRRGLVSWSQSLNRRLMPGNGRLLHLSSGSAGKFLPTKVNLTAGREVQWCSCGQTKQPPFCTTDSCNGKPMAFKAKETKEYIFCNCKNTNTRPICDGSHAK